MIKNGEFYMIHEMKKRGMNISQIAHELGRDRKTISKWLAESEPKSYQRRSSRPSKLEPFKSCVRQRMEEGCLSSNIPMIKATESPPKETLQLLGSTMAKLRKTNGTNMRLSLEQTLME